MALLRSLSTFRPDNFTLAIVGAVGLASLLPAVGGAADAVHVVTILAIALLFFLHGARLSREAVLSGALHWRLHLVVLCSTFVLFPLLGVALRHALDVSVAGLLARRRAVPMPVALDRAIVDRLHLDRATATSPPRYAAPRCPI